MPFPEEIWPEFEVVTEGLRFPEGPIAMADGSVLVVEIAGQALTRILPDGSKEVIAELDGGPNGAAIGPDGCCYICNSGGWIYEMKDGLRRPIGQSMRSGWIEKVDLRSGVATKLYEGVGGQKLNSPNDIVFDSQGGFWLTDLGKRRVQARDVGAVYYAKPDGSHIECAIPNLIEPNGIGLSPDEGAVYVAETATRRVLAFDLIAPGKPQFRPWPAPSGGRLVAALGGMNNLDSMAIDGEGHVCVASLGDGGVWELSPDGARQVHHRLPDYFTTNICFGGAGLRTAFVTMSTSGRLVKFRWPRAGRKLNFNA